MDIHSFFRQIKVTQNCADFEEFLKINIRNPIWPPARCVPLVSMLFGRNVDNSIPHSLNRGAYSGSLGKCGRY